MNSEKMNDNLMVIQEDNQKATRNDEKEEVPRIIRKKIPTTIVDYGSGRYEGEIYEVSASKVKRKELKHGRGKMAYNNGDVYEGEWVFDKKHGEGELKVANGRRRYKGSWKDGKRDGEGEERYANGDIYKGRWKDDKFDGEGEAEWPGFAVFVGEVSGPFYKTWPKKKRYKGSWKDGKRNGVGEYIYADGSKYKGSWKDNKRHGEGEFIYSDGKIYRGSWRDDEKHGEGESSGHDGNICRGSWRDNEMHGEMIITWGDGRIFEGSFNNGYANGFGALVYPHRRKIFEGYFEMGRAHGQGIMMFPDGTRVVGQYENGKKDGICNISPDLPTKLTNSFLSDCKFALYTLGRRTNLSNQTLEVKPHLPGSIIDKIVDQYIDNRVVSVDI